MKQRIAKGARVEASLERAVGLRSWVKVGSLWTVEHYRSGRLISMERDIPNIVTNEGLDADLDIMFHADTQITAWFVLLFETNTTPAAGHTYAVPVFTECTAYDEATRPAWVEAAASGESITNSANKANFTMNDTKTIYGAALVGGGTDADTIDDQAGGGTLYCSIQFGTSKPVESADVLKITVTLNATDVP